MNYKLVTGWSDAQILEAVSQQTSYAVQELEINKVGKGHIAAVVDFDGPEGVVVVDKNFLVTGPSNATSGEHLYISTQVFILGNEPSVRFIHKKG
ncbi:hypothetical protein QBC43DRAFT_320415 [Cladorrhinum sp. PSN259]|nr:hypothetical protein QBC43DRAFT_320415 [Cladorrhinum sp. PSN259]